MKLKKLIESEYLADIQPQEDEEQQEQKLTTEQKQKIAETVAQYNKFGRVLRREYSLDEIATNLSEIAESAESFVLNEMDDWFDKITVTRNMKDLRKLSENFTKIARDSHVFQQRMEALYEDMGNILNRYFEIADDSDDLNETKEKKSINEGKKRFIEESIIEFKEFKALLDEGEVGPRGITSKQWKKAGLPFEGFLKYAQCSKETRKMIEDLFAKKYPKVLDEADQYLGRLKSSKDANRLASKLEANGDTESIDAAKMLRRNWKQVASRPDMVNRMFSLIGEASVPKSAKFDGKVRVKVKDKRGENKFGYELGMGYLGNGLTVWNRNLEVGGDYAKVAHIQPETGKIKYYDTNLPPEVKKEIEHIAAGEKRAWDLGQHYYQSH